MPHIVAMFRSRTNKLLLVFTATLFLAGCAALNPPDPAGPRTGPAYPVLFAADDVREEATELALRQLAQRLGNFQPADAKLQPVTATIAALPPTTSPLYLPKVGIEPTMTEEETRESLRRFIREWQGLIGADPAKLSLVEHADQPDGSKLARYEQRPFRYPIRGDYGSLVIRFMADRRVVSISSTAIPDADRLQSALNAVTVKLSADDAIAKVRSQDLVYQDANGTTLTFKVPSATTLTAKELVTYIRPSTTDPTTLTLNIAWEIELTGAPVKFAYVDAVDGSLVAVR